MRRIYTLAGLKVVFALLDAPERVNLPYRQIADMTDVALGTVDWIFRDLKEKGFLMEMGGRKRRMTNLLNLLKRWVEAYPDQLRPKLGIERLKADHPDWWQDVDIADYNACWGGEVAAARITKQLKPEKVIIYASEPPGKLIIEAGNLERFFEEADILKEEDSDYDLSSARFLGRDMARLAGQATNTKLCDILERKAVSTRGHQITMDVLRHSSFQNESYERIIAYFDALLRGLVDQTTIP